MLKNFANLYNEEIKLRFLKEEYPNDLTQRTYGSLLQQLSKFERYHKKDLCDFSYSEAVDSLIGLRKKTLKSLTVALTIIVKYINWCGTQGYSNTGINAFKLINKKDLEKFVHQIAQKESYISRERLYEIIKQLYNPIDQALLALLFEGVRGRVEFEEIRNLEKTDVSPISNTLTLTRDNGEERTIKVDEKTMSILLDAIEQEEYYKNNGEATGRFAVSQMRDTNYVFRATDNGKSTDNRMAVSSINTRFRAIRKFTGENFLNPTLVFQSGLLEKCEEIDRENGGITSDDYRSIYTNMSLEDNGWYTLKTMYENYKKNLSA